MRLCSSSIENVTFAGKLNRTSFSDEERGSDEIKKKLSAIGKVPGVG
jgi:hypothetical protein